MEALDKRICNIVESIIDLYSAKVCDNVTRCSECHNLEYCTAILHAVQELQKARKEVKPIDTYFKR